MNSIIQTIVNSCERIFRFEMNGCVKCVTDHVHHTQHHTVGFIEILANIIVNTYISLYKKYILSYNRVYLSTLQYEDGEPDL